jgi:hypothetical protein
VATAPTLEKDAELIERILREYASIPYANRGLEAKTVFDRESKRFLKLTVGWDGSRQVHGVVVDVELREGKFWIHRDGTEEGIAADLEQAGIPKDRIVLAWIPEDQRRYSEYAVR